MEHFKPVKSDKEKVLVSVRLNVDILEKIDELSAKADISRNEFKFPASAIYQAQNWGF